MDIKNEIFKISTQGFDDVIDITQKIKSLVKFSDIKEGLVNIFIASSTSGIFLTEQEPGICEDIKKLLSYMAPINKVYQHDVSWYEGNGYSYLRAVFFQKNLSIPVINGDLAIDKYQQIIVIDFDNKPSVKTITTTLITNQGTKRNEELTDKIL